ncbi:MAG: hypothetical protein GXO89_04215 [Chlorobi bacterium]|nr:hypothetical protein [Chlorobiota bacterium]
MKTKSIYALGMVILLSIVILVSCSKSSIKDETSKNPVYRIGTISQDNKSLIDLTITLPEVLGLMQKHNPFMKDGYSYSYDSYWIESFTTKSGHDYFLAVGGAEADKDGRSSSSCYTVYLELSTSNNGKELVYGPGIGETHSCTGHQCSQCVLKYNKDGYYCECKMPVVPEGYCDHSVSQIE